MIEHGTPLGCKGALNAAASVVTTNDDVFDAQMIDCELEHGENSHVAGVHVIGNVALDENLAGVEPNTSFAVTRLSEQPTQR